MTDIVYGEGGRAEILKGRATVRTPQPDPSEACYEYAGLGWLPVPCAEEAE